MLTGGVVTSFTITNGGSGYTTFPAVTVASPNANATAIATISGGTVNAITIVAVGAGYGLVPTVTISAPTSGTQATAVANLTGGMVTAIAITNPGSGYTSPPTVTISAPVSSLATGGAFGLVVKAEDPYGNINLTDTSNVALALTSNPAGAALGGTTTVAASAGVATFAGCR